MPADILARPPDSGQLHNTLMESSPLILPTVQNNFIYMGKPLLSLMTNNRGICGSEEMETFQMLKTTHYM